MENVYLMTGFSGKNDRITHLLDLVVTKWCFFVACFQCSKSRNAFRSEFTGIALSITSDHSEWCSGMFSITSGPQMNRMSDLMACTFTKTWISLRALNTLGHNFQEIRFTLLGDTMPDVSIIASRGDIASGSASGSDIASVGDIASGGDHRL